MGVFNLPSRFFNSQAKVIRSLLKQNLNQNNNVRSSIYVLGCGYKFNPKSVIVSGRESRFLFNCGPGLTRLLNEHKKQIRRLSAVFVTRSAWENVGGLPSLALGLNDSKVREFSVYGYPDLEDFLSSSQVFFHLHHTKLVASGGDYKDNSTLVSEIKLKSDPHLETLLLNQSPDKGCTETVTAYVMRLRANKSQSADIGKMLEIGIPPGSQIVDLMNGKSVTLPNGKVVQPEEVTLHRRNSTVVVLECPTEDYIRSVEESDKLKETHTESDDRHTTVIHFSPMKVIESPRYIKWMKKFSSSTLHLIVNESNLVDGLITVQYRQMVLSKLHPGIFPPLKENSFYWLHAKHHFAKPQEHLMYNKITPFVDSDNPDCAQEKIVEKEPSQGSQYWLLQWKKMKGLNIYECRPGTAVSFHPFKLRRSRETLFDELLFNQGFKSVVQPEMLAHIREKFLDIDVDLNRPLKVQADYENSYPRVIFLGTGSKKDSKNRNVSGILLRISKNSSILLDCGEGIHAQIFRFFGDRAPEVFRTINAIYISHLHGDHQFGLVDIIRERAKAFNNRKSTPLLLYVPKCFGTWFDFLKRFLPKDEEIIQVPLHCILHGATDEAQSQVFQSMNYLFSKTGLIKLQTVRVPHCNEAYGVTLQHADGWKITYSGDCVASTRLDEIGEGSDLLIHEATYDDINVALARRNRHSTFSQALEAGRRMNAKFTILTHVSQRYASLPVEEMTSRADFTVAFDFMQVPLKYIHHLPLLHEVYASLNDSFKDELANWKGDNEDRGSKMKAYGE